MRQASTPPAEQVDRRGLTRVVIRCVTREIDAVRVPGEVGECLVGAVDVPVPPHGRQGELRVPIEFVNELDGAPDVFVPPGRLRQPYPCEKRPNWAFLQRSASQINLSRGMPATLAGRISACPLRIARSAEKAA